MQKSLCKKVYYVSITGVTGTASADINALTPHVQEIKSQTDLPVVIGFGIKTPEDVKEMAQIGDGVVVGSAIVNILQSGGVEAVKGLVSDLSSAIRSL